VNEIVGCPERHETGGRAIGRLGEPDEFALRVSCKILVPELIRIDPGEGLAANLEINVGQLFAIRVLRGPDRHVHASGLA